jgi:predicted PurR-regulated permease PerM
MEREIKRENSVRLLVALANTALGLALLVALVWAGLRISHALLIFSLGILVAYALEPLVARLRTLTRGRLSQGAGVFLVLIAFVSLLALLVYAAVSPTERQIRELAAGAPALHARADAAVVTMDH